MVNMGLYPTLDSRVIILMIPMFLPSHEGQWLDPQKNTKGHESLRPKNKNFFKKFSHQRIAYEAPHTLAPISSQAHLQTSLLPAAYPGL